VFVLLLIPLDLAISLPGMLTKSIRISAPSFAEQNSQCLLKITAVHEKPFPVRYLRIHLRVRGDDFIKKYKVLNTAGDRDVCEVPLDTSQTGLYVFEVKRLSAVSLIGLFSLPIKTSCKASVLVLPPAIKPENAVNPSQNLIMKPKRGGGFSEEHDMRKYLPGDPIKNIHWKLSAKFDTLIIREPLVPPRQSRLVHISEWKNAEERDRVLSHLRWVSAYLLDKDFPHYVKFGDRDFIVEILNENNLVDFLRRVLDNNYVINSEQHPRVARFSWVYKV